MSFFSALGINNNGEIVGLSWDFSGVYEAFLISGDTVAGIGPLGFVRRGGEFTTISYPSAYWTMLVGIDNNGVIFGTAATDGGLRGFRFANGSYELLESSMAQVEGISMNGSIVGVQPGGIGPFYGNGVLTDLVLPGANGSSLITGGNSGSDIVALDSLTWRGYTTIPTPEPGTVSLVEAVGTALIVARRRGRR